MFIHKFVVFSLAKWNLFLNEAIAISSPVKLSIAPRKSPVLSLLRNLERQGEFQLTAQRQELLPDVYLHWRRLKISRGKTDRRIRVILVFRHPLTQQKSVSLTRSISSFRFVLRRAASIASNEIIKYSIIGILALACATCFSGSGNAPGQPPKSHPLFSSSSPGTRIIVNNAAYATLHTENLAIALLHICKLLHKLRVLFSGIFLIRNL